MKPRTPLCSLLCLAALLAAGCDFLAPRAKPATGDLDWAWVITDEYIAANYSDQFFPVRLYPHGLTIDGRLTERSPDAHWRIQYYDNLETYVEISVFADGRITITEETGYDYNIDDYTPLEADSADVRAWLDLARQTYRYHTGESDDCHYHIRASTHYSYRVSVTLFDAEQADLGFVAIDPEELRVIGFDFGG
ncbi:MAG: hypothetical protein GF403_08835 [Candidatus Coatesbacteria bacterium]|nr:hypothetical protein [Candidatus Coatesbacteria bacterium]